MSAKVVLATRRYRPGIEAVAQEICALRSGLQKANIEVEIFERLPQEKGYFSLITDLARHWNRAQRWIRNPDVCIHVLATSRNIYFNILFFRATRSLLTLIDTNSLTPRGVKRLVCQYHLIAVESEYDRLRLIRLGLDRSKVILAPPFSQFANQNNSYESIPELSGKKFRILMASMPFHRGEIRRRGLDLLLNVAAEMHSEIELTLACRTIDTYKEIQRLTHLRRLGNIRLLTPGECDMNLELRRAHTVVYPFPFPRRIKSCPHSLVEGLSCGRPILASGHTGIAHIIRREGCGEVFDTQEEVLATAIRRLVNNYYARQARARGTYQMFFGRSRFMEAYSEAYSRVMEMKIRLDVY